MPNGEMEEKMDKFIVNIIHRPEMVPEYAEKVTGHGKEEDLGRKALLTESLDIFKFQQETAHKNGLKTTIQMTYASLFNDEAVALAKADHEKYGDEIALSLLGLPCTEFRDCGDIVHKPGKAGAGGAAAAARKQKSKRIGKHHCGHAQ